MKEIEFHKAICSLIRLFIPMQSSGLDLGFFLFILSLMLFNFSKKTTFFYFQLHPSSICMYSNWGSQTDGMECSVCLRFLGKPNLQVAGQRKLVLPFLPALSVTLWMWSLVEFSKLWGTVISFLRALFPLDLQTRFLKSEFTVTLKALLT